MEGGRSMRNLKPETSKKNPYYVSKHRMYELIHFCLQYPEWKKTCNGIDELYFKSPNLDKIKTITNEPSDPTAELAMNRMRCYENMKLVENIYDFCKKQKLEDKFYKKMVAHEYAQNIMRIRKSTSYSKFVVCMSDKEFRKGIKFADASQCTLFEKILFLMVKHKIYSLFALWIW